ncbi:hypothetical protein [Egibacter rhizosphaerae]|uniref:hypothetical protein n=1 Tax=Egibacter rhizosphaerae TaxID=1670831 RepID=UPI00197AAFE6|nr:hypothetical protein [Egibacter rhizosphaerae]
MRNGPERGRPAWRRFSPWQAALVALALWQIVAAGLSQSDVLPGAQVGTISDRYDSWIDPAGYAFAIWGLIYVASLAFAIYQARPVRAHDRVLAPLRVPARRQRPGHRSGCSPSARSP